MLARWLSTWQRLHWARPCQDPQAFLVRFTAHVSVFVSAPVSVSVSVSASVSAPFPSFGITAGPRCQGSRHYTCACCARTPGPCRKATDGSKYSPGKLAVQMSSICSQLMGRTSMPGQPRPGPGPVQLLCLCQSCQSTAGKKPAPLFMPQG